MVGFLLVVLGYSVLSVSFYPVSISLVFFVSPVPSGLFPVVLFVLLVLLFSFRPSMRQGKTLEGSSPV